jgi:antitoxin component YwqK of YwqJK toxin-antitoxin module
MTYKNGFLDGPYEGYSYNHYKLVARGNFVLDKPDGDWQYFYTNGKEKARGFYNAGKLIGNWQIYFNTDPDKEGVFDYPSLPVKKDVDPIEQFIYSALTLPDFSLNLEETDGYIELKINGNNMLSENVTGKYADGKPWFEKRREGRKIIFKKYYPDGTLHFEMEQAEEDKANVFMPEPFYKLISYWDEHGNQTVSTGNGEAVFYEADRHPQRNTYVNGRKVL